TEGHFAGADNQNNAIKSGGTAESQVTSHQQDATATGIATERNVPFNYRDYWVTGATHIAQRQCGGAGTQNRAAAAPSLESADVACRYCLVRLQRNILDNLVQGSDVSPRPQGVRTGVRPNVADRRRARVVPHAITR